MHRIREHLVYICLFGTLLLPCAHAASSDDSLLRTIAHLLRYVEESNCVFIRNGKDYNSKEAAKHIKTKYDSFMLDITTPGAVKGDRPLFPKSRRSPWSFLWAMV